MARYIDADALNLDIDLSKGSTVLDFALAVIKSVKEAPTADVVPKSEYDAVVSAVDNSTKEFLKLHDKYQEQKSVVERLQGQVNRLKKYDEERDIALHARLIAETREKVVREIFEEIERNSSYCVASHNGEEIYETKTYTISALKLAELKKKRTEGET